MKMANIFNLLVFFVLLIWSCQKDFHENPHVYDPTTHIRNSELSCDNIVSNEYDIIALAVKGEFPDVITTLKTLNGELFFDSIEYHVELAILMGWENWLNEYGATLSSYFKSELVEFEGFVIDNIEELDFNFQMDSLIEAYLDDSQLDLEELNALIGSAKTIKGIWEFFNCDLSEFATRGDPNDDLLCTNGLIAIDNEPEAQFPCVTNHIILGVLVGSVVGTILSPVCPPCLGWGAVIGGILGGQNSINRCNICDDCHHPRKVSLVTDFTNCEYSGAEFLGSFAEAEGWEFEVTVASGNFSGTVNVPRITFPSSFDTQNSPFTIKVETICDGGSPPVDDIDFYSKQFSSVFSPLPWMLFGNDAVSDSPFQTFKFEMGPSNSNLTSPTWTYSSGVSLTSSGTSNGVYYANFSFYGLTNPDAWVKLTLYDNCLGIYTSRSKTVKITPI
jgi:hypothetical protein